MKPKLTTDESAVSEVIGALMIFGIIVGLIAVIQSSQVPVWNAAVEREHFDRVCSDFVELRADIEDAEKLKIPKSSDLQMGVRYPERFIFRNPGVGASGTITTYPLNVNVSYSRYGSVKWKNYTSAGIIYEMHGTSESPRLVYEHGLIIKDYGGASITEEEQSLITGESVFIPIVLWGGYSFSSMGVETFSMLPVPQGDCTSVRLSSMNVTLETRYPDVWNKSLIGSGADVSGDTIEITDVSGSRLRLPSNDTSMSTQKQCYVGMVTVDASTATRGPTGPDGIDVWAEGQGRLDIPGSNDITEFCIRDITLNAGLVSGEYFRFTVFDADGREWIVDVVFKDNTTLKSVSDNNGYSYPATALGDPPDGRINLTSGYQNASIRTPNALTIEVWDTTKTWSTTKSGKEKSGKSCKWHKGENKTYSGYDGILYVNFLIN